MPQLLINTATDKERNTGPRFFIFIQLMIVDKYKVSPVFFGFRKLFCFWKKQINLGIPRTQNETREFIIVQYRELARKRLIFQLD